MKSQQRVAIVYDRVNTFGGAERVLQTLHAIYPDATLYTSVYEPITASWTKNWRVIPSFLQRIPWLRTHHQYAGILMPLAFESFNFSQFDLVISVTSEAAKGIVTQPHTKHVCYLLTPTRYLWNKSNEYEHDFYRGWKQLLLPLHRVAVTYLRWWDTVAAARPDIIIPISNVVKERCARFYHRTTTTPLFPPINTALFQKKSTQNIVSKDPFYLCVARLVPYKRIDLAIQACTKLHRNLVIVGTGTDLERLKQFADNSPSIQFAGHLTDSEMVGYYQQCTGLLFPGEEDFGITAVEAMAAGKPVVVFTKSGHAETVLSGITGILMQEQSVDAVIKAMLALERQTWDHERIQRHALQYDQSRWKQQWRTLV
jgi:glycosyltransferase involved in cell wall biosynthesis